MRSVAPMLATLVEEPFDRKGWLFEIKWDGYRAIATLERGRVRLTSRNDLDLTARYAPVVDALKKIKHNAVIDGEVVVLDTQGKSSFESLQNYGHGATGRLVYAVFDLLSLDGKDLRKKSLLERKRLLKSILPRSPHVKFSDHVRTHGKAFFAAAKRQGLEGVMAKDAASPYREGVRGGDWVKIKARQEQEVVIGGYTDPSGERKRFGALVAGVYEGDNLVYIGHVGGGFDEAELERTWKKLQPLARKTSPFATDVERARWVHWVRPELVAEVAFAEWTNEGILRQPVFLGWREDKSAREVVRERAGAPTLVKPDAKHTGPTHVDKVFWPKEGYTKGDVLAYYEEVAPLILPYLKDRPLSLNRHPNGITGDSFFQKDVSSLHLPAGAKTVVVHSDSERRDIEYLVCQNAQTLAYIANLGCIEMNPWNARQKTLERADYLVIDLDPGGVPFSKVIEVARAVHEVFDALEVPSYPKTSGGKGLHIYVPLGARYTHEEARLFAELVAALVAKRLPTLVTAARGEASKRKKVNIDLWQNKFGATNVAAYSLRPRPGAPVSTPLEWREVNARLDPLSFNLKTVRARFDKKGDLFAPVLGPGTDLARVLKRLSEMGDKTARN